ncbi:hypothetical protein DEM27_31170 [Metarhizobium album]|uniref:Uncharacterized protein n=1 Tax=Metarhizobium album TaxID=2182425 RepID=A0A2U2DGI5_9HYPH|nr:hypothetical protein [Rhizobium album]PWE52409.1 hypothetical protein DEM27_31170 [Rhizobium album]
MMQIVPTAPGYSALVLEADFAAELPIVAWEHSAGATLPLVIGHLPGGETSFDAVKLPDGRVYDCWKREMYRDQVEWTRVVGESKGLSIFGTTEAA